MDSGRLCRLLQFDSSRCGRMISFAIEQEQVQMELQTWKMKSAPRLRALNKTRGADADFARWRRRQGVDSLARYCERPDARLICSGLVPDGGVPKGGFLDCHPPMRRVESLLVDSGGYSKELQPYTYKRRRAFRLPMDPGRYCKELQQLRLRCCKAVSWLMEFGSLFKERHP